MKKNNKSSKTIIITAIITTIITFILINTFLSGKIIDIPKGTHEGGIISAVGVLVIIVTTTLLSTLVLLLIKKITAKKSS